MNNQGCLFKRRTFSVPFPNLLVFPVLKRTTPYCSLIMIAYFLMYIGEFYEKTYLFVKKGSCFFAGL